MEYDVIIPKFDTDGTIVTVAKWYKKPGDYVKKDEILAEVESDLVSCEIVSPVNGTVSVIYIPEGRQTRLGMQIAIVQEDESSQENHAYHEENGENFDARREVEKEIAHERVELAKEKLEEKMAEEAFNSEKFKEQEKEIAHERVELAKEKLEEKMAEEAFNSEKFNEQERQLDHAKAQKLAEAIVKERPETDASHWKRVKNIATPNDSEEYLDTLIVKMAKQRNLCQKSSVVSTVINEIDMSSIISIIDSFQGEFIEKYGVRLGFTPFIIKAIIVALKEFPMFNAFVRNDKIVYKQNYDISLITKGFDSTVFPVLREADKKSIDQLEREMISLSERCERQELTLEEASGSTFTLINAGLFGSLLGSDVVSCPHIASFSMHKVTQRAVAHGNTVLVKPMMYVSLSFDNRLANTKDASMFMNRVKQFAENIGALLLGL